MSRFRIAGVNFDHFHMGDNLRAAYEHPDAEIVERFVRELPRVEHDVRGSAARRRGEAHPGRAFVSLDAIHAGDDMSE